MVWETGVQSQVESYQRLKKWYLVPPCLTHSIIRWGSRVKWSNPGNGVAPSPTPRCSSCWKGSPSTNVANITFTYIYIYIYIYAAGILCHLHNKLGVYPLINTYIYIYMYVCVCVCVCVYTHIHTHTHIYIYIYIYIL